MIPTSNHNLWNMETEKGIVVYLLIPTSNHNCHLDGWCRNGLYIFWFLHQTTTKRSIRILHKLLYIFWFLHQTTTTELSSAPVQCCISFDSYIKPQPQLITNKREKVVYLLIPTSNHNGTQPQEVTHCVVYLLIPTSNHNVRLMDNEDLKVVYLLIPTSNHNHPICLSGFQELYIFWFLHQTTTSQTTDSSRKRLYIFWFLHQTTTKTFIWLSTTMLYIFWFLHQTTTASLASDTWLRCISFDSYIKPQPVGICSRACWVVYLLIPTSNHNVLPGSFKVGYVVYLLIPTSNHNWSGTVNDDKLVVYLLIPTSNHNLCITKHSSLLLYIFWFLHQTTTYWS